MNTINRTCNLYNRYQSVTLFSSIRKTLQNAFLPSVIIIIIIAVIDPQLTFLNICSTHPTSHQFSFNISTVSLLLNRWKRREWIRKRERLRREWMSGNSFGIFFKYSKNIKSVKITHLLAIAGCSGILVSLQSRVALQVGTFCVDF